MLALPSLTMCFRAAALGAIAACAIVASARHVAALGVAVGVPLPPVLGASELFVTDRRSALALAGADPVAYFTEGAIRFGRAEHETSWQGIAWRFGSAANRDAFAGDPQSFAPRIGGYDALMAARGVLVEADPGTFRIVAGRLYLFRTDANRRAFEAEGALADRAERRWGELRAQLPRS